MACREAVAIFDQTSFSKYVVHGADAEAALQWICSNDVAVANDETVYTALLNARGGYESDLTVTRVADDEYFLVSSSATTERDQDWIRRNIPAGLDAQVADVTDRLVGARRHGTALARAAQPADRCRPERGRLRVRHEPRDRAGRRARCGPPASRTSASSVGSSTSRTRDALGVYDAIKAAGADLGLVDAGYYAIEAMRLEKGYRAFGRELTPEVDPGRGRALRFTCKLGTDIDFLGRAAVEKAKAAGPSRRLVSFVLRRP